MPATQMTSSVTPACFWAIAGVALGLVLPFARLPFAPGWASAPFWSDFLRAMSRVYSEGL